MRFGSFLRPARLAAHGIPSTFRLAISGPRSSGPTLCPCPLRIVLAGYSSRMLSGRLVDSESPLSAGAACPFGGLSIRTYRGVYRISPDSLKASDTWRGLQSGPRGSKRSRKSWAARTYREGGSKLGIPSLSSQVRAPLGLGVGKVHRLFAPSAAEMRPKCGGHPPSAQGMPSKGKRSWSAHSPRARLRQPLPPPG